MLVIGLGNRFRRDDAAGLEVARRLGLRAPANASVVEWDSAPDGLLERWANEEIVVVVDATRSGAEPGTLSRFDATTGSLSSESLRVSSHAVGLGEVVELARALDRLPDALIVWGIEGSSFDPGEGLHPDVERTVDEVVDRLATGVA